MQILTLTSDPCGGDKPIFPGEGIFELLVDRNSPLVVALINRRINVAAVNQDGDTALHLPSAIVQNVEIVTRLRENINAIGNVGAMPIHCTSAVDAETVQVILKWDADITIKDAHHNLS